MTCDHKRHNFFINLIKEYNNVVILRSLTKTCGLAGLRIGYAASSKKLIEKINNKVIAWNVNGLSSNCGKRSIERQKLLKICKKNN